MVLSKQVLIKTMEGESLSFSQVEALQRSCVAVWKLTETPGDDLTVSNTQQV